MSFAMGLVKHHTTLCYKILSYKVQIFMKCTLFKYGTKPEFDLNMCTFSGDRLRDGFQHSIQNVTLHCKLMSKM